MKQRLTEVIDHNDPEMMAELEALKAIADAEGLTIVEYMQREAQKILDQRKLT